jgi:hypothetical protein
MVEQIATAETTLAVNCLDSVDYNLFALVRHRRRAPRQGFPAGWKCGKGSTTAAPPAGEGEKQTLDSVHTT